ncbi:hypothetical protein RA263_04835 [Pseudomonas syringae pv. tagetis]|uniref:Uncharacterized protein n=1 Tax=Pseudomonas syringae pv. tagetis TaxID=129140 RepID=A0ABW7NIM8_9PSED|nr:hypothetical protein [Pseudomonas syringae group genomosp. 7]UNB70892.1 hypothetical protein MME58_11960 [Pseudomonas syringae pv. tagetis]
MYMHQSVSVAVSQRQLSVHRQGVEALLAGQQPLLDPLTRVSPYLGKDKPTEGILLRYSESLDQSKFWIQ